MSRVSFPIKVSDEELRELKRLLFQGGQEKLRDKEAVYQNTSASKAKKRR